MKCLSLNEAGRVVHYDPPPLVHVSIFRILRKFHFDFLVKYNQMTTPDTRGPMQRKRRGVTFHSKVVPFIKQKFFSKKELKMAIFF